MTTATKTSLRVPVRGWREKAILASAIGSTLGRLREQVDLDTGFCEAHLLNEHATNRLIDEYFGRDNANTALIVLNDALLRELRSIEPGADAALVIPAGYHLEAACRGAQRHERFRCRRTPATCRASQPP